MKIFYKCVLVSILALSVVGCGTTGNKTLKSETEGSIAEKIKANKTTKKEVQSMLGAPFTSGFDGGLLVWTYQFDDTSLDGVSYASVFFTLGLAGVRSSGTRKQLTILFNDDDTVKKMNMAESPITTGTMLLK